MSVLRKSGAQGTFACCARVVSGHLFCEPFAFRIRAPLQRCRSGLRKPALAAAGCTFLTAAKAVDCARITARRKPCPDTNHDVEGSSLLGFDGRDARRSPTAV